MRRGVGVPEEAGGNRPQAGGCQADLQAVREAVRAVADELASAAELALGKTSGRPIALIRGASFTRGQARIADALIPAEMDLFR